MKKSVIAVSLFAVSLFLSPDVQAQIPAAKQSEPIALTGGTIHTISGEVLENATILFEDGVITAIGTDVNLPAGTHREDVSGKHIYPGLIDSWNQMGIYEIGAVEMSNDINEQGSINPNVRVERAFNPESRHIGVARSAGILTSITSPGGGIISGQSAAMMMDGWAWDEMTLKAGVGLILNWPNANDTEEYVDQLQELRDAFADARSYKTAKDASENGNGLKPDFDSRWDSMIPVFEGERPVVVNANEVRQIQDAITWADEEDIRLVILGGRDAHLVGNHLRDKNIPVIITSVLNSPNRDWQGYDTSYTLPSKLFEMGVQFAIAGTSSAPYSNRLPYEAGAASAYGLPAMEALKSLTLYPAQILGIDEYVGSLEVGKHATLLITTGNPMEYSTQIDQVYVQGRKSDMIDKHRDFYNKYREKVDQRQAER